MKKGFNNDGYLLFLTFLENVKKKQKHAKIIRDL